MKLNTAELVSDLLPTLIPYARVTPQDVVRVDLALDLDEAIVVVAPELVLPVGLERCGLWFRVSL